MPNSELSLFLCVLINMLGASLLSIVLAGQVQGLPDAPEISVYLKPSHSTAMPGDRVAVVVEMDISDPWHVYWKNPGDSGIPTKVDWVLPAGWKASETEFPTPHRLDAGGLISYGFEHKLRMLSWVTIPAGAKAGQDYKIKASLSWLACIEQCVKGDADVATTIRVGNAPIAHAGGMRALTDYLREAPRKPAKGLVEAWRKGDGYTMVVRDPGAKSVFFFADRAEDVSPGAEQVAREMDGSVVVDLVKSPYSEELARRLTGVLTYIDRRGNKQAYSVDVPVRLPTRDGENK